MHLENYKLAVVCPFDVEYNLWDHKFVTSTVVFGHTECDLSWCWDLKVCECSSPSDGGRQLEKYFIITVEIIPFPCVTLTHRCHSC